MKNGQISPSKFCHSKNDNKFLSYREIGKRSYMQVRLQKLTKLKLSG